MKILIHGRGFPVAMWRWFDFSLRDLGHEVFSVGCYSGGTIPWGDKFFYPQYKFPPDWQIPEMDEYPLKKVLEAIPFTPDLIIQASDVTHLTGKAPCKMVLIKTDPHAVDYSSRVLHMDHVFNMQHFYLQQGETWLPYAYYPPIHKFLPEETIIHDVMFSGLQYPHRVATLEAMEEEGLVIHNTLGLIYDEYVQAYNQSLIAFNWSSKNDLPARFWEGLAMRRLILTNRVPDLQELDCKENVHFVAFESEEEAVEKAKYYVAHEDEALKIAEAGYKWVKKHSYYNRVSDMLEVINNL